MSEDGLVRPCLATITGWMNLGILFVLAYDNGWRWYDQVYQLPPYSEVIHTLDGHRNTKGFFYFILFYFILFLAIVALGVLLPYWLLCGGVAHIVDTYLTLIGQGVLFLVKTFSVFPYFSRQNLLIFAFLFSLLHLLSTIGFFDFLSCAFCF